MDNKIIEEILNEIKDLNENNVKLIEETINMLDESEEKEELKLLLEAKKKNIKKLIKFNLNKKTKVILLSAALGLTALVGTLALKKDNHKLSNNTNIEIDIEKDNNDKNISLFKKEICPMESDKNLEHEFFEGENITEIEKIREEYKLEIAKKYMIQDFEKYITLKEIDEKLLKFKLYENELKYNVDEEINKEFSKRKDNTKNYAQMDIQQQILVAMKEVYGIENKTGRHVNKDDYDKYYGILKNIPQEDTSNWNYYDFLIKSCEILEQYIENDEIVCVHNVNEETRENLCRSFYPFFIYLRMIENKDTVLYYTIKDSIFLNLTVEGNTPIYSWIDSRNVSKPIIDGNEWEVSSMLNNAISYFNTTNFVHSEKSDDITKQFEDLLATLVIKYYEEKGLSEYASYYGNKALEITGKSKIKTK